MISPLALEAVQRIDALFAIEREINGLSVEERRAVRQERSAPLVADLETWMQEQRARLSPGHELAKAMTYMLKRWASFTRFLEDGRICLSNNAAERALRGIALGRKSWLFAGSDRGGQRAAFMYSLIVTAKMNDVDPQAWLAEILARIAGHPASGSTSCCRGIGDHTERRRGLTMAAITRVFTIGRVAQMLGENEDWLHDIANEMEPEDGCLWIYGVGEKEILAFTDFGIDCLRQIIADKKAAGTAPPQLKPE